MSCCCGGQKDDVLTYRSIGLPVPKETVENVKLMNCPKEKGAKTEITPDGDLFEGKDTVTRLNMHTFKGFLKDKDKAIVIFYDPQNRESMYSKDHFLIASQMMSTDPNKAFASVNCVTDNNLCLQEGATTMPYVRIYSKGHTVGTFRETSSLIGSSIVQYMSLCPVLTEPPRPICARKRRCRNKLNFES